MACGTGASNGAAKLRKPMIKRKKRTRQHVIADLSLHHVAYTVVKCGYTLETTQSDYGYDALLFTYSDSGEVENGNIFVQLKATDQISKYRTQKRFLFPVDKKDVDLWQAELFPVYLILFDASAEAAYWLYFQKYLQMREVRASGIKGNWLSVEMDAAQIVDEKSVRGWRADKAEVLAKIGSMKHA